MLTRCFANLRCLGEEMRLRLPPAWLASLPPWGGDRALGQPGGLLRFGRGGNWGQKIRQPPGGAPAEPVVQPGPRPLPATPEERGLRRVWERSPVGENTSYRWVVAGSCAFLFLRYSGGRG